jgi:HD-like signal output (HDOD) protein
MALERVVPAQLLSPVSDDLNMTPPVVATFPRAAGSADEPHTAMGARRNEGHGQRLTAAFEALEIYPALAESRDRVLALVSAERPSIASVVAAIESDVALVISVMRLANALDKRRGRVESIVAAVEVLSPDAVQGLAFKAEVFEFFERGTPWEAAPERFRLHAVGVQRAADLLAAHAEYPHRDRLLVTALLHDFGKLVLMHAYPGYPRQGARGRRGPPRSGSHYERRELGVDHALVGGVLARR